MTHHYTISLPERPCAQLKHGIGNWILNTVNNPLAGLLDKNEFLNGHLFDDKGACSRKDI